MSETKLSRDIGECLGTPRQSVGSIIANLKAYLAAYSKACANYCEAASIYEQLSKLGDAVHIRTVRGVGYGLDR